MNLLEAQFSKFASDLFEVILTPIITSTTGIVTQAVQIKKDAEICTACIIAQQYQASKQKTGHNLSYDIGNFFIY